MWIPFDESRRFRTLLVLIVFALGAAFAVASQAQESPDAQGLRQQIEKRYQVLPIHGGVVLTPKPARPGVQTIEVSGADVAVNGERVNTRTLRDWLGEADAAPVLRLLELSSDQRRALFDMPAEGGPAPAAEPEETSTPEPDEDEAVETPEVPETPEIPETPAAPASPEPSIHSGSRVRFGGSIVVEKDELAEEAVSIGGSVRIDGEVSRDAVAVGGPVRINGHVGGNVTSVGSSVHLGPEAVVEGDVTSVGGTIERAKGAQIHGSEQEVSPFRAGPWNDGWDHDWDDDWDFGPFTLFGASMRVFGSMFSLIATVLFAWLCLLLARGPMERVEARIAAEPWKAAGIGLAGSLSLLPLLVVIAVVLAITIIGCFFVILLYPVLAVVIFFAYLFGYAAVALRVGRWFEVRFGRRFASPYISVLVGVVLLQAWWVIAQLLSMGPGVLDLFALMFRLFAFALFVAAMLVGFGGILQSAFGSPAWTNRWSGPGIPPVPPVPPVPPPPPAPHAGGTEPLPLTERWEEEPPPPES
jgi:cytoskeletal protein CcmA (bactofilin family)